MARINIFAPVASGADRAEASSGALEIINGYVDAISETPGIKLRPGSGLLHDTSAPGRVDLYWWEAKRILLVTCGKKIFAKTSRGGNLRDITPVSSADIFPFNSRVFFSADEHGVHISAGLQILWWGGDTSIPAQKVTGDFVPSEITSLTYLKGYTIASVLNTQEFAYALYGPTDPRTSPPVWQAQRPTASASPDDIITLGSGWEELFILGRESTQSHYASGDVDIPFPALSGSTSETGIVNARTLQKLLNTWLFATPQKQVVIMNGRNAESISHSIEQELRRLTHYSDAEAFILFNRFYVLTFPTDQTTFVWDSVTRIWSRWEAWDNTIKIFRRFPYISSAYAKSWGLQIVGDFEGKIYYMDHDLTNDNGAMIRMRIRSGHLDGGTEERKFPSEIRMRLRRGDR